MPFDVSLNARMEITKPFKEPYGKLFYEKDDGLLLRTPNLDFKNLKDGTDLKAISEGKISVTPISLALFYESSLKKVEQKIKNEW
jgi:broad specificity polyphosphatase/5'/3'-nucleotidase SurE